MKKITIVAVMLLLLYQTKAQNFNLTYGKEFISGKEIKFKNEKIIPQTANYFSVGYSQSLKKLPITINVLARLSYKNPPPFHPPIKVIVLRPGENPRAINNAETDSSSSSSDKTSSFDFLLGAGYVLPHKAASKFIVTANIDFGVSLNNNQTLKFYYKQNLTGTAEVVKTQFILNPSIKAKYSLSKAFGIGLGVGYSNIGGVNTTATIIINPFRRPKDGCTHWQCCGVCDWFNPQSKKKN